MSTHAKRSNILPHLQREIVLHLAKTGPQDINETVEKIKHSYKPSWIAFNALEAKGLIKKTDVKIYRNRKYSRYWLTEAGIFVALVEGADANNLLERTIITYPDNKTLQCTLEIAPITGLEGFRVAISAFQHKGKLDESDTSRILFVGIQKDTSLDQLTELLKILRKYPTEYERVKNRMGATYTLIAKILSVSKKLENTVKKHTK